MQTIFTCVRPPRAEMPLSAIPETSSECSADTADSESFKGTDLSLNTRQCSGDTWNSSKSGKSCDSTRSKTDRIIKEHRKKLLKEGVAIAKFLEKNGFKRVDVNCPKPVLWCLRGTYPLHEAVSENNAAMVSLLLRYGADPTAKDTLGYTAYQRAKAAGYHEVVREFQGHHHCSDKTARGAALSVLERLSPPGFEDFFAALERDPLVRRRLVGLAEK